MSASSSEADLASVLVALNALAGRAGSLSPSSGAGTVSGSGSGAGGVVGLRADARGTGTGEGEARRGFTESVADAIADAAMAEGYTPPKARPAEERRGTAGQGAMQDDLGLGASTRGILEEVLLEKRRSAAKLSAVRNLGNFDDSVALHREDDDGAHARRRRHTPKTDATHEARLKAITASEQMLEAELLGVDPTLPSPVAAWEAAGDGDGHLPEEYQYHPHAQHSRPTEVRRPRDRAAESARRKADFVRVWHRGNGVFEDLPSPPQPPSSAAADSARRRKTASSAGKVATPAQAERFYLRQVDWQRRKECWREERAKEKEAEAVVECTFTPNNAASAGSSQLFDSSLREASATAFERRLDEHAPRGGRDAAGERPPRSVSQRPDSAVASAVVDYEARARAGVPRQLQWQVPEAPAPASTGGEEAVDVWTRLHDEAEKKAYGLHLLQEHYVEEDYAMHHPQINSYGPEVQPRYLDRHPAVSMRSAIARAEAEKECTFHPKTLAARGRTPQRIRQEGKRYEALTKNILGSTLRHQHPLDGAAAAATPAGMASLSPAGATAALTIANIRADALRTPPRGGHANREDVVQHTPDLFEISEADIHDFDWNGGRDPSPRRSGGQHGGAGHAAVDVELFTQRQSEFLEKRNAKVHAKRAELDRQARVQKPVMTRQSKRIFQQNNCGNFLERVDQSIIRKKKKEAKVEADMMHDITFTPVTNRRRPSASKPQGEPVTDEVDLASFDLPLDKLSDQLARASLSELLAAQPSHASLTSSAAGASVGEQGSQHSQGEKAQFKIARFRDGARSKLNTGLTPAEYAQQYQERQDRLREQKAAEDRQREEAELAECTFKPKTRDAPSYIKSIAKSYSEWRKSAVEERQAAMEQAGVPPPMHERPFQYP